MSLLPGALVHPLGVSTPLRPICTHPCLLNKVRKIKAQYIRSVKDAALGLIYLICFLMEKIKSLTDPMNHTVDFLNLNKHASR